MKKYSFTVYYQHEDYTVETKVFEFDSQERCTEGLTLCQRINCNNPKVYIGSVTEKGSNDENISWDEYFMNVAILTSLRSKDKNTKVGSVLVDSKNRIIGAGYNGLPSHIDESKFPTSNNKSLPYNETKYAYVAHAELNSILNTTVYDLTNSKIYCTLFPCNECAKVIIQKGISEIIYLSDKYHDKPEYIASRKLLDCAGIPYRRYVGSIKI